MELGGCAVIVAISFAAGFIAGGLKAKGFPVSALWSSYDPNFGLGDDCKMALIVRTDLKMGTGKIAAQCSHATLACYKALQNSHPKLLAHWEKNGQTKVTLKCTSEADLLALQKEARILSLCAKSIRDAGRTQIAAGSRTVLGILGPAKLVNQVTSKLRLL
ncbi:peptidyl-tRNA hydrolase PTH2-domain-containing protein [Coprinopsis sp. MPI-PUGE-AT-0042]|nr:peptidyl-tRNA hydrolase PTH2-domain-containing protein [Coprinopsis sp. MPI-PUGE-AT-0042]